jgi:hypothetical protein
MAMKISVRPELRLIMRSTGRSIVILSFLPSITVTLLGAGVGVEEGEVGDEEGGGVRVGEGDAEGSGVPEYSTT